MKLAFFNDYQLGVITTDGIVDISDALSGISYHTPQELIRMVIEDFDNLRSAIADAAENGMATALDGVSLKAPLPRPGQLVCLAGNYIEPDSPSRGEFNAFLKSPTGIISTKETVQLPEADVTVFHFEPELAIVIGKTAKHLSEENALDCVFGYTQFIDVSARGLPGGFFLGKSGIHSHPWDRHSLPPTKWLMGTRSAYNFGSTTVCNTISQRIPWAFYS